MYLFYRYVEHVNKTSAKKALNRTIPTGNPWQTADRLGNKNCHQASKKGNSPSKKPLKRKAGKGKSPRCQMCIRLMTVFVKAATAIASHASDCTATPEDAHLSTGWVLPPWSDKTDG